ncbi:MAG TPA: hypothetical protein VFF52_18305 [Isosphaeraceae bacterium]|nr:hypothetical protein [Isosphaeraceae bacterium]
MVLRMTRPSPRLRFQIQEVLALVVGYGMAALLVRAFWPSSGLPRALGPLALVLYLWLGLAMSGPILLLRHREQTRQPCVPEPERSPGSPGPTTRTWAEWAWLCIGVYWIVLGLVLIPSRLHEFRFGDALLFGLVPIVVALVFRFCGSRRRTRPPAASWTHLAAVALLACWPIAWLCLIILGQRLP